MDSLRRELQLRLTTAEITPASFVITIAGELDLANAARLHEELDALVDAGAHHVVVDLLEVPFVESTVLGILLQHVRRLRAREGELTIVTDDARVLRVFEITGLESHFTFARSLNDVVEELIAAHSA